MFNRSHSDKPGEAHRFNSLNIGPAAHMATVMLVTLPDTYCLLTGERLIG